jgi:transcriptional regulator with XRE-family HTH domain
MLKPTIITDPKILAETLKLQRKALKATQEDLAGMNDISRYTIVDAESGRGDPKLSTILTLLNGLGISLMAVPNHMADRVKMLETVELEPEAEEYLGEIDDWDFDIDLTT